MKVTWIVQLLPAVRLIVLNAEKEQGLAPPAATTKLEEFVPAEEISLTPSVAVPVLEMVTYWVEPVFSGTLPKLSDDGLIPMRGAALALPLRLTVWAAGLPISSVSESRPTRVGVNCW